MKNRPTMYLAGPITGLSFDDCTDWRKQFTEMMGSNYRCLSPMRAKEFLRHETNLSANGYDLHALSTQKGITTRDRFDCTRSDLIIMNLLDAKIVSVGTCIEIGWASEKRVPILLIMEKEGNLHDHAMVRECVGWRVETLEEGVDLARAIL